MDVMEENKMHMLNEPIITTTIGAVIGVIATILGGWVTYRREKRNQESMAATILYNDLKSIERYLAHERSSVNLRYSNNWQHMIAGCPFFEDEDVEWLYRIYDMIYNYNYHYRLLEQKKECFRKEDVPFYEILQKNMFDISKEYIDLKNKSEKYEKIIESLEKHKKS